MVDYLYVEPTMGIWTPLLETLVAIDQCCLYRYPKEPLDLIWNFEDSDDWRVPLTPRKK